MRAEDNSQATLGLATATLTAPVIETTVLPAVSPTKEEVVETSTAATVPPDTPPPDPKETATSLPADPQPVPTLAPDAWMSMPVVPEALDPRMYEVYLRGLELGNNPQAFSKIGDCGSTPAWFLGDFDRGPKFYRLGEHTDLQTVIEYYNGSFSRTSLAAKEGFNASSVFTQLWANRDQCQADETPLACEYRVHRPVMAFIMLGTNDVWHPESFEPQMRKIIEYSLENGVIPILSTKADNEEEDGSINATIAGLAVEYGVPLWNYWLAVQPLPDGGLQEDGAHITWAPNRFDDPQAMKRGWPVRNLTALQMLNFVWRSLNGG